MTRDCPNCDTGIMRVLTSRRIAEFQQQRRECTVCGHRDTVTTPRTNIFLRCSTVEQPKDRNTTNVD